MKPAAALEAVLFVAEGPITEGDLVELLEIPLADLKAELSAWSERLESDNRGIVLRYVGGGWRLYSKPEALRYLKRLAVSDVGNRLSQAALEVLAVVAYRQPVTRGQISELRGVDSGSALSTLNRRGLVAEQGRLSTPGNPAIYATTDLFLETLGMGSLADLPPLADHMPSSEVLEALDHEHSRSGDPSSSD